MGKPPAFQMYASDFHMDTCSWSVSQVGIYTRLLMYAWVNGFIPDDAKQLARIAGCSVKKFNQNWPMLIPKWKKNGIGQLQNQRMEDVREKQDKYVESRRKSAEARWSKDDACALRTECSSSSTSSSNNNKQYIHSVFDHWNEQKIMVHKDIKSHQAHISSRLKVYSHDEVIEAISNYKKIIDSPDHYFTYKWTLKDFLQKGLDKFLSVNDPFTNYKEKDFGKSKTRELDDFCERLAKR